MKRFYSILLSLGVGLGAGCGRPDRSAELEPILQIRSTTPPASGPIVDLREQDPIAEVSAPKVELPAPDLNKPLGAFKMTYYWVAAQPKSRKRTQKIVDKKCRPIARVSKSFKHRLNLEGSGKLEDGRVVNKAGSCNCGQSCFWVAGDDHKWGAGVGQRPLSPFRSVAVDPHLVSIGTTLYVAELDGLTMPGSGDEGGFVHDGCVVADDRGGGVRGKQIDFFAARRSHYQTFFKRHKITRVSVYSGGERCRSLGENHLTAANHGSS